MFCIFIPLFAEGMENEEEAGTAAVQVYFSGRKLKNDEELDL